jgi:hypothetical protein
MNCAALQPHPCAARPSTHAGLNPRVARVSAKVTLIYPSKLMHNRSTEDRDEAADADGF